MGNQWAINWLLTEYCQYSSNQWEIEHKKNCGASITHWSHDYSLMSLIILDTNKKVKTRLCKLSHQLGKIYRSTENGTSRNPCTRNPSILDPELLTNLPNWITLPQEQSRSRLITGSNKVTVKKPVHQRQEEMMSLRSVNKNTKLKSTELVSFFLDFKGFMLFDDPNDKSMTPTTKHFVEHQLLIEYCQYSMINQLITMMSLISYAWINAKLGWSLNKSLNCIMKAMKYITIKGPFESSLKLQL